MNWAKALCVAASLTLLGGAPATAAILWQQTFDPDPSGLTRVTIHPNDRTVQSLYLYLDRGTLNSVYMFLDIEWQELWWERHGEHWHLSGNEYFRGIYPELHPSRRMAQLIYQEMPSFYTCEREPKVELRVCAQSELDQRLMAGDAIVAGRERFTLTLSNERPAVPEPSTWALMITGFGGVGAMLRGNRRRNAPAL